MHSACRRHCKNGWRLPSFILTSCPPNEAYEYWQGHEYRIRDEIALFLSFLPSSFPQVSKLVEVKCVRCYVRRVGLCVTVGGKKFDSLQGYSKTIWLTEI